MYHYQEAGQGKQQESRKKRPNRTGIPEITKKKFEDFSGYSFDDVKIHYNSPKPESIQAYAYTQGNQVYIAPGQQKYLEHELGHVVQQKQGIVRPTKTIDGLAVNDDRAMEQAADRMRRQAGSYCGGKG